MMPPWLAWGLNLPLLALAIWALGRRTARGRRAVRRYGLAVALRVGSGVALGALYMTPWLGVHEGGDTALLHRHAAEYTQWAQADPAGYARLLLTAADQPGSPHRYYKVFSNSHFFVRGLSLLHFLTGGSYWLNGLWLSLAALAGSWLLARELARLVPGAWRGAYTRQIRDRRLRPACAACAHVTKRTDAIIEQTPEEMTQFDWV